MPLGKLTPDNDSVAKNVFVNDVWKWQHLWPQTSQQPWTRMEFGNERRESCYRFSPFRCFELYRAFDDVLSSCHVGWRSDGFLIWCKSWINRFVILLNLPRKLFLRTNQIKHVKHFPYVKGLLFLDNPIFTILLHIY